MIEILNSEYLKSAAKGIYRFRILGHLEVFDLDNVEVFDGGQMMDAFP